MTLLEGESLINDASALVLHRFAVAAAMAGSISLAEASLSFLLNASGGAAIGLAVGWATVWLLVRLNDRMLEILVSFLSAFASYLAAEAVHVSGVLAAVAAAGWSAGGASTSPPARGWRAARPGSSSSSC